jgi:dihydroxycyclohexadiene carboxylate dehydrogenase
MVTGKVLEPRAAGGRRFENKICVVAGAGQGIGSATVRRLAQEGGTVVIGDMVESTARKVQDEVRDFGGKAITYIGDLSTWENAEGLMKRAIDEYGRIDVLANIVGGTIWMQSYWYYTPEQIIAEVNKSFWPTMWLCRAVLPYMIEQKGGSIVNLATHAVMSWYRVPYAASKGGLIGLTTSLSKEVGQFGIRVNIVAPHATEAEDRVTPRKHGIDVSDGDIPAEETEAVKHFFTQHVSREVPIGRRARAEEQASAIAFLASDDASFITGQVLPVGGGATYPF